MFTLQAQVNAGKADPDEVEVKLHELELSLLDPRKADQEIRQKLQAQHTAQLRQMRDAQRELVRSYFQSVYPTEV